MHPEPLLRMFTYPALYYIRDCLHRAVNVHASHGVARGCDFISQLDTEAMAGQPNHPHAVDWAFELARKPRQHRVCFGAATEERYGNALHIILIPYGQKTKTAAKMAVVQASTMKQL